MATPGPCGSFTGESDHPLPAKKKLKILLVPRPRCSTVGGRSKVSIQSESRYARGWSTEVPPRPGFDAPPDHTVMHAPTQLDVTLVSPSTRKGVFISRCGVSQNLPPLPIRRVHPSGIRSSQQQLVTIPLPPTSAIPAGIRVTHGQGRTGLQASSIPAFSRLAQPARTPGPSPATRSDAGPSTNVRPFWNMTVGDQPPLDQSKRHFITLNAAGKFDQRRISATISETVKTLLRRSYMTYEQIPEAEKDVFWQRFKRIYQWNDAISARVYNEFNLLARVIMTGEVSRAKKDYYMRLSYPNYIGESGWIPDWLLPSYIKHWEKEETKGKAVIASRNRSLGRDNTDTCKVSDTYAGGSGVVTEHAEKMVSASGLKSKAEGPPNKGKQKKTTKRIDAGLSKKSNVHFYSRPISMLREDIMQRRAKRPKWDSEIMSHLKKLEHVLEQYMKSRGLPFVPFSRRCPPPIPVPNPDQIKVPNPALTPMSATSSFPAPAAVSKTMPTLALAPPSVAAPASIRASGLGSMI